MLTLKSKTPLCVISTPGTSQERQRYLPVRRLASNHLGSTTATDTGASKSRSLRLDAARTVTASPNPIVHSTVWFSTATPSTRTFSITGTFRAERHRDRGGGGADAVQAETAVDVRESGNRRAAHVDRDPRQAASIRPRDPAFDTAIGVNQQGPEQKQDEQSQDFETTAVTRTMHPEASGNAGGVRATRVLLTADDRVAVRSARTPSSGTR